MHKALSTPFSQVSREWVDGIVAVLFREFARNQTEASIWDASLPLPRLIVLYYCYFTAVTLLLVASLLLFLLLQVMVQLSFKPKPRVVGFRSAGIFLWLNRTRADLRSQELFQSWTFVNRKPLALGPG